MSKFKQQLANGLIDLWHNSPDVEVSLHEFLHMTWDEYAMFVETGDLPDSWSMENEDK